MCGEEMAYGKYTVFNRGYTWFLELWTMVVFLCYSVYIFCLIFNQKILKKL